MKNKKNNNKNKVLKNIIFEIKQYLEKQCEKKEILDENACAAWSPASD